GGDGPGGSGGGPRGPGAPARVRGRHFDRPVTVPDGEPATVRLVALVRGPGRVEVALRCAASGFHVDHFRATVAFGPEGELHADPSAPMPPAADVLSPVDPATDLYADLLFQSGRFRRLRGYRRLGATGCCAELDPVGPRDWFGPGLAPDLVLGDPGLRDAAVHA